MAFKFKVSHAFKEDISEILQIQGEVGLSPWSFEGYADETVKTNSIFLKAFGEKDGLLGFIVLSTTNFGEAEILNFGVRENAQKKGVGTVLLKTALKEAVEKQGPITVWLEVRESNCGAVEFYRKNLFEIAGRRRNFYSQPKEDALLMKLETGGKEGVGESFERTGEYLIDCSIME